jgi:hypothetical protein
MKREKREKKNHLLYPPSSSLACCPFPFPPTYLNFVYITSWNGAFAHLFSTWRVRSLCIDIPFSSSTTFFPIWVIFPTYVTCARWTVWVCCSFLGRVDDFSWTAWREENEKERKKKEAKVGRGAQLSQVVDDSPGGADENSLTVPIFHPSTVL